VAPAIVEQSGEDRRAFLVFVERIPKNRRLGLRPMSVNPVNMFWSTESPPFIAL